jgi:hypothetical protein
LGAKGILAYTETSYTCASAVLAEPQAVSNREANKAKSNLVFMIANYLIVKQTR